jgi:L-aspartate oxidase
LRHGTDFLVIGSGIAGLSFALAVAEHGTVTIVTKKGSADSATNYAQGGIAAVMGSEDQLESHVSDTLACGAGLCDVRAVEHTVAHGREAIEWLVGVGVRFDREACGDAYALGREGGHTHRRVLHAADFTGQEIERALLERAHAHPRIQLLPNFLAIDLVTQPGAPREDDNAPRAIAGAYVLDAESGRVSTFSAPVVLLASGGCGKVYLYTSNPEIASGDGVAMAARAGATIANMELIQFHPTCLYHHDARSFLITEALRGEGAVLRTRRGDAFMAGHHPLADLAPRDIVARAIDLELKRSGDDCVYLDATGLDPAFLVQRFPNIHGRCLSLGIDITKEPIPVVPAAHYSCGGVLTDLRGESSIQNLFAAGEVACTGLHGANRLASNSLLEGVVFAHAAAREVIARFERGLPSPIAIRDWDPGQAADPTEAILVNANWDEIRRLMWNYVGIVRSDKRLERARRRIAMLHNEIRQYYWDFKLTPDLVELRNLATVASLIVHSASTRRESRGLHYTIDHPEMLPEAAPTILRGAELRRVTRGALV